ncbi:MAG: hypothetical protein AAGI38_05850 [Bacteroidota bacterium]
MKPNLNFRWQQLEAQLEIQFGKKLNMEAILFLIGMREIGAGPERTFEKEEKVDLIHVAICRLLAQSGYYRLSHQDQDGWPHWELLKPLPHTDMFSQVNLLREHVLVYMEEEGIFEG